MMAPGFQLVVGQNPLDCLRRNRLHHPVTDQLPGQFGAIPLGQRPPEYIGAFAGQFDDVQRRHRGKKPAAGRVVFCRTNRRGHTRQSAAPTYERAAHATPPAWRWLRRSIRRPRATWHAPVWPALQGSSVSGATPSRWHACGQASQCGLLCGVPAYLSPSRCRAGVMKHRSPHCQFFRPFSMGTCT